MKPFVTVNVKLLGVLTRLKRTDIRAKVVEYMVSASVISESYVISE
jgi:hypothetical protein